jgi:NAD(P)-dependent dehydrogenase (short-subunit alcohol dehydrogenase family)
VDQLVAVAELRRDVSEAAGRPMVMRRATGPASRRFASRADLATVAQVGPATPDHVLRTKRVPLLGRDVAGYAAAYRAYVERHRHRLGSRALVPVDPAPRVVIDPELGVLAAGRTAREAAATAEIAEHTIWVIERAAELGGYASASEPDVFDVEYWELEQAKLARQPPPRPLAGRAALVTGAASGIGRACARALLAEGAAVVGVDVSEAIDDVAGSDGDPAYAAVRGDVTDPDVVAALVARAVGDFGGLDVLVINAGVFPPSAPVAELPPDAWAAALTLNATAAALALKAAHPFLRLAPGGGRVVVVGSKNVPAPGVGAAAYSASKAALTQLARVTALEWGGDGITVNVVHPDAVFDTGLWDDAKIAERAARYGLTPEQYRTRNVLGTEVSSADVAALVVALCGPAFARTTGAQIPVDGGNDRVI